MKIAVLIENTQRNSSILAEHGLSLYIETTNHKLLSDCGCTDAFLKNAVTLGIDLTKVDSVFLSHGHYDHSGGILPFSELNSNAPIYMQDKALCPYYHKTHSEERYIGIHPAIAELPQLSLLKGNTVIDDELSLFTNVTGRTLWPKGNLELKKKVTHDYEERKISLEQSMNTLNASDTSIKNNKKAALFIQDEFDHEQYLVITETSWQMNTNANIDTISSHSPNPTKVLISGCAHNGILNILEHYHSLYNSYPDAVISGFHMRKKTDYTEEDIATITETAHRLCKLPTTFYTGHCTGEFPFALMKEIMGEQLIYAHSGDIFYI